MYRYDSSDKREISPLLKFSLFCIVTGLVLGWLVNFETGCKPSYPPEPDVVIYPPYQDGGMDANVEIVQIPADCRLACESLAKLGCPESATPPGGRSCGSVCAAALEQGIDLPTICIANASTVDQVRACGMIKCKGR